MPDEQKVHKPNKPSKFHLKDEEGPFYLRGETEEEALKVAQGFADGLATPKKPLEVYRTGETKPFARLLPGPIAPWEEGYDKVARIPLHADRVEAGKAPPSMPDRGGGHAPGAAAQQQERGGPAR